MTLLEWRESQGTDRAALTLFQCTVKPTKSAETHWHEVHPRFWEHEVQSIVRDLRPPARPPEFLLLGFDDEGIAAVSHWEELDGPSAVELLEMGVALRHRGQGGAVAREMFVTTLDWITARAVAADVALVDVIGMVWHENGPSQRMCRQIGLDVTGHGAPGVQKWSGKLPVALD